MESLYTFISRLTIGRMRFDMGFFSYKIMAIAIDRSRGRCGLTTLG
jgi:hypothetical protein